MMKWLLELIDAASPSSEDGLEALLAERRRLAEAMACYREFGFDAQVEGCKDRLHRLRRRIREVRRREED
ncbi:MAG TPA: hypothetical protein VJB14_05755 [Planctomycetota bacterium]|nr:hypothetical protein [Planctomycetota bacterium]